MKTVTVAALLLLAMRPGLQAAEAEPKKIQEALNKVDVGFFLLLDKKEQEKANAEALNKVDRSLPPADKKEEQARRQKRLQ